MTKNQIYSSIIIIFLMVSLFYGYAKYSDFFPSTEDAYLQANIVNVAAQVTGPVKEIFVQDHQYIKAGQLLFTIDPKPFEIALAQSQASLAETKAQLDTQIKDTSRILELVSKGQMTKMAGDDAQGKLNQLTASLKVAQSSLDNAQLNLQYTNIYAPSNGYITNFTLRKGEMVQATYPLFTLVEDNLWWVNANFKETDLERIKIGQSAKIIFDMYPNITFKGKVQGISAGSGATFAVLPPENATGNWVKVTQRFPVRIDIINPDSKYPLRMGASCEVKVDTR